MQQIVIRVADKEKAKMLSQMLQTMDFVLQVETQSEEKSSSEQKTIRPLHQPTINDLLIELDEINQMEPVELLIPPRQDRINTIVEAIDELPL